MIYSRSLGVGHFTCNSKHNLQRSFRRSAVREEAVELAVGDTLVVGDHCVTIMEIDGSEICFRIDDADEQDVLVHHGGKALDF